MTSTYTGEYTNIAIPQSLLQQAHLDSDHLDFELRSDGLLLKSPQHPSSINDPIFGLWKDKAIDGVEIQQKLRSEWEREDSV